MIEVRLYGPMKQAVGTRTVRHDGGVETVGELLDALADEYPGLGDELFDGDALGDWTNVLKNGSNIRLLDGTATPVEDGDVLSVTVAQEGG